MIIVEDGTGVAGANSYVSLPDAREILDLRGQNLDIDDVIAEQQLIAASDYVEAFRDRFQGWKTSDTQSMQWPRVGVVIDNKIIDSVTIPIELVNAQVFAAYEFSLGTSLQPTVTGQSIQAEEVVGAVKVSYFATGAIDGSSTFVRVMDSLNPLFICGGAVVRGMRG